MLKFLISYTTYSHRPIHRVLICLFILTLGPSSGCRYRCRPEGRLQIQFGTACAFYLRGGGKIEARGRPGMIRHVRGSMGEYEVLKRWLFINGRGPQL